MIRTAIGVLELDAMLTAVGYALISPWLRGASAMRAASFGGVAFLAGAGVSATGLEILAVVGFRTDPQTFLVFGAVVAIAGLAARVVIAPAPPRGADAARSPARELTTLVPATLLTALACGLVYGGFRSTPWLDDSWAFWLPKGILLDKLGLDPSVFTSLANPDYPLGWSALLDLGQRFAGHIDLRGVNGVLATFTVGFIAATARLLWGLVRPPLALGGLLFVAISPEFLRQALGGGADIPLACFVVGFAVAACRWLLAGDSLSLFLAGVFAAGALAVKNEAVLELVLIAAAIACLALARRSWRRLGLLAAACGAAALTAIPWLRWRQHYNVQNEISLSHALSPSYLSGRTDRIHPAATALYHHLTATDEWLLLVPIALVASIAAAAATRRLVFLLPIGLLAANFAALVWIYWVDPEEISGLLFTSSYRTVDTMPILAGLVIAVAADALATVVARRGSERAGALARA